MPRPEFIQGIGGQDGPGVQTNESGSIETDNYTGGESLDVDGSAYPYTLSPAFTAEVVWIREAGDVDATITYVDGTTTTLRLHGGTGVVDWWSIESIEFTDPRATAASLSVSAGGDTA
jgi:hypothetical protein